MFAATNADGSTIKVHVDANRIKVSTYRLERNEFSFKGYAGARIARAAGRLPAVEFRSAWQAANLEQLELELRTQAQRAWESAFGQLDIDNEHVTWEVSYNQGHAVTVLMHVRKERKKLL